jgi:hypothetical protein
MKERSIPMKIPECACRFGVRWLWGEGTHRFGLRKPRTFNIQHPISNENRGVALRLPPQSRTRMRQLGALLIALAWLAVTETVSAGETWQDALYRMPLGTNAAELNRTNCVPLMLDAFQSNAVVKALIFLPGATDELYFFRRVHAGLTNANPSLLDAVVALTNQTYVRATFQPPLLLLHTSEDALQVITTVKHKSTAARLRERLIPDRLVFTDAGWDEVRAALGKRLSIGLRPFSDTPESGHFYRHNFAACGATEWEILEAIALADKTTLTVHWWTVVFQIDRRSGTVPEIKNLRAPGQFK